MRFLLSVGTVRSNIISTAVVNGMKYNSSIVISVRISPYTNTMKEGERESCVFLTNTMAFRVLKPPKRNLTQYMYRTLHKTVENMPNSAFSEKGSVPQREMGPIVASNSEF